MTPQRVRAIRHGLFIAGLAVLVLILSRAWLDASTSSVAAPAYDAFAYWAAAHGADPYARDVLGAPVAYYYSPAFLQVFAPLLALPFPAFLAGWYALNGGALVIVARQWLPVAIASTFVPLEVLTGNIETLMALAIVAGFRWPAAWAFILLTKVTPGIGLLYFVGRREWRNLAIATAATVGVAAISFVLVPGQWWAWFQSLVANTGVSIPWAYFPIPLFVRLPIAAALALIAGIRGWKWLVPVASTLAVPALWPVNLTLLVAVFPLLPRRAGAREGLPATPRDGGAEDDAAATGGGTDRERRPKLETA